MFTRKDIIKLLIPLIIEQILAVLVGMSDVVMVAAVGEAAVSGVSLVDAISVLIIQILAALATGGAVISAQYLGRKKPEDACKAAGQLLLVTTLLSVTISAVAFIGNVNVLKMIFGKVDSAVMSNAVIYFRLSALSYPFLAIYNSCAALYRTMGNSKVSMIVSLAMNAINVTGNAICIFGLHMGVEGVGIPTLVSRAFAACLMLYLIQNPKNVIRIQSVKELRFNPHMIRNILSIGIPNGLESGMFQFGKIALQSLVASLGTAAIASYAVANNLVMLQYIPGTAIGLSLVTIVGQCVGAGRYAEAKKYTKELIVLNYILAFAIGIVMVLGSKGLVGLYNLSPEAAKISRKMLWVHAIGISVWPLSFTIPHTLRASLDAKFTMTVSVLSMWIFRIGFGYLFVLVFHTGVMGVWYAMFIDWIFRAIVFHYRFRSFGKCRLRDL